MEREEIRAGGVHWECGVREAGNEIEWVSSDGLSASVS